MTPAPFRSALALAVALSLGLAACDKPAPDAANPVDKAVADRASSVKAESARLNAWFEAQYEE